MKSIFKTNGLQVKTLAILLLSTTSAYSFELAIEPSQARDFVQNLMSKTLKNPSVVGKKIKYRLTKDEACDLLEVKTEGLNQDDIAQIESQCDTLANGFSAEQVIYDESNESASGKVIWSFDNHKFLSVQYSPAKLILSVEFPQFRGAYLAALSVSGGETNGAASLIPNSGAVRLTVENKNSSESSVEIAFPQAIAHTILAADSGLPQDLVINLAAGSIIKSSTHLEEKKLKQTLSLKDAYFRAPAGIESYLSDTNGNIKEFSADEISYEVVADLANFIFQMNNLKVQNLSAKKDDNILLSAQSGSDAASFSIQMGDQSYQSSTEVDLRLTVNPGTWLNAGQYQLSHAANGSFSYSNSNDSYLVRSNLSNLVLKAPAQLVNSLQSGLLSSDETFSLSADKISGEALVNLSEMNGEFENLKVENLDVNQGAGDSNRILTLNIEGALNGLASAPSLYAPTIKLGAQETTLNLYNSLGFSYPAGVYQISTGANTSIVSNIDESQNITAAFYVESLDIVTPEALGFQVNASSMSGTGSFNMSGGTVGDILNGSLGNIAASVPGYGSFTFAQSAPTVISANLASEPFTVSATAATTLTFNHSSSGSYGSGSATISIMENTSFEVMNVIHTGGIDATLNGSAYADLFGENGMLDGFAFTGEGTGNITVNP